MSASETFGAIGNTPSPKTPQAHSVTAADSPPNPHQIPHIAYVRLLTTGYWLLETFLLAANRPRRYHSAAMNPAPAPVGRFDIARPGCWLALLAALWLWHAWLSVSLFGTRQPWNALLDDRPITSGAHPVHLYFGWLGASSMRESGTPYCYDPSFQAGFPKTPIFDSGSRPAELFLALAGGRLDARAYKLGLLACCLTVPGLLWVCARGVGLNPAPACLAVGLGLLVWWGNPCRNALEAGNLDLLMGGLCAAAFVGLLIRVDRDPRFLAWLGLYSAAILGWLTHPLLYLLLFPVLLVYYLRVGPRHRAPWHVAFVGALLVAPGLNAFWLIHWLRSWWLRLPLTFEGAALSHRTLASFWESSCWGSPEDRAIIVVVFAAAFWGIALLNRPPHRTAARVLGLGTGGLAALTLAGLAWSSVGRFGTAMLLLPALWLAIPAAVFALVCFTAWLGVLTRRQHLGPIAAGAFLLVLAIVGYPRTLARAQRLVRAEPFAIGLSAQNHETVRALCDHTSAEARILWEELTDQRDASRWTALLPLLTGRAFLGGLGPDVCIEHAFAGLVDQKLAGRSLNEWTDADLARFCHRYGVGWIVCRSPKVMARFDAWLGPATCELSDGARLYSLPARNLVLKGQARIIESTFRRVTLTDVVPENGQVVLSLHYQSGILASPARVVVERDPDPYDPIPFVRLRVPTPVSHLTLTWQ
jgi:hypothetical protein